MNIIYNNNFEKFYDKDLIVLPIQGKNPGINGKGWQQKTYDEKQTSGNNIGLLLGEPSGVICIDIDTFDVNLQKKIYDLLPPLYSGKRGDKSKGNNYFFKYNGEHGEKIPNIVELLSTGNMTVLPPSIHPTMGYPYEWAGKPLHEIDIDDLAELPPSFMNDVRALIGEKEQVKNEIVLSDGSRCNHGSHLKLSDVLKACIFDGKTIDETVDAVLNYDEKINPTISYFQCPSRPWRLKDKRLNAHKFAIEGYEESIREKEIEKVPEVKVIEFVDFIEKEEQKPKFKALKLPNFRGVGDMMAEYIYEAAPIPRREMASAAILSTGSTVIGNKIRLGAVHPNLYCLIVAPSGQGKDFHINMPTSLFQSADRSHFIGEGHPVSDTSIIASLKEQRVRLDAIDEASILFKAMTSSASYHQKMRDVYAQLYTNSGKHFNGKNIAMMRKKDNPTGNIGKCFAPYVGILAAMTPAAFRECFDTNLLETGLGSRFLIFTVDEKRMPSDNFAEIPIPENVISWIRVWSKPQTIINLDPTLPFEIPDCAITEKAKAHLIDCKHEFEKVNMKLSDGDKMQGIYNRVWVNMVKLSIIDAAFQVYDPAQIKIKKDSIEWAYDFMKAKIKNMENFVEYNVSENMNEKIYNKVLSILSSKPLVSKSEFYNRTRSINKMQKDGIMKELLESGSIELVESNENGKLTRFYRLNNLSSK